MVHLTNITKQYGPQILFVDASVQVNQGEKVGLVGPNGSGKTTLFRLITREESPDEGEVSVGKATTLGYFRQDVGDMRGRTVLQETVAGAGKVADLGAELEALEQRMGDPALIGELERNIARFGEVQENYQALGGYELEARAHEILAGLGFAAEQVAGDVGQLSGGWKMRVALARILLSRPDVLLLDEPTNHLDIESIVWLEHFIRDYDGAVFMTCHDREFMNRVVGKIVEIDGGTVTTYTGNYDFYERKQAENRERLEAEHARQQAMLQKEMRFVERFKTHAAKASQVQSRLKKLEKIETVQLPRRRQKVRFRFRAPPRSGDDVVRLSQVSKSYGAKTVYRALDLFVRRGERWAVMGENGAGKSTLLKLIAEETKPDSGVLTLGASLKVGYFAQHAMELLDGERTVYEELESHAPKENPGTLRTLLAAFGFYAEDLDKPVRVLSGGERARLVLAVMLRDPPNLLVLDEPTNHLDLDTKQMLVDALTDFQGTMLFVSHDRSFLRGLANRVLELGAGHDDQPTSARVYAGSYEEYVRSSGHEAPGLR
jgi:ATPase subunit of ABC transporter with duplicated ATPase domains